MEIMLSESQEIAAEKLEALFLSVFWESGKHPEKLKCAITRSDAVISAWDCDKLIGLGSAITDGEFIVYIPWLLVAPEYRRLGIGTRIMKKLIEKYGHIPRIVLNAYNEQISFYKHLGFTENADAVSMMKKKQVL
ncbi:MAG: N-acetyltransferase [Spirochaetaceae bacterium]|nr:MAG: N-acetyltransferase [Spirochaetaceae bacterium]